MKAITILIIIWALVIVVLGFISYLFLGLLFFWGSFFVAGWLFYPVIGYLDTQAKD